MPINGKMMEHFIFKIHPWFLWHNSTSWKLKLNMFNSKCHSNFHARKKWCQRNPSHYKSPLVQVMTWRQQAVSRTRVDPDPCCHMASLGHTKPTETLLFIWNDSNISSNETCSQWIAMSCFDWLEPLGVIAGFRPNLGQCWPQIAFSGSAFNHRSQHCFW